jgi:acyl-CoA synthetase (AMP-forming)/AMP-acid ligase II
MNTDRELERNLIHRVNVGDALTRTAAHHPTQEAVIDGERRFTYRELDTWVNRVANGLLERGYRRGDALAVMSGNSVEFLVAYYACAKTGVVCVPLNLGWGDSEASYVLRHAKARGVVVESQLVPRIEATLASAGESGSGVRDVFVARGLEASWAPRLEEDRTYLDFEEVGRRQPDHAPAVLVEDRDPISYLYTSGTTAAPKGVVGSHLAVHLESLTVAVDMELRRRDRVLCMMPMFHTAQLNAFCTPSVTVGATMVLLRAFDAALVLELVERESLSVAFGLPMMYRALVAAQKASPRPVGSLRLAVYAMAPMPDHELRQAMECFGCGFALLFGQTEMSPVATLFRPEHQLSHMGAVGTPGVNVQVAIMSEDGALLSRGETGEIVYRGPHVVERYLDDEASTNEAFRHGWFHSGDTGHMGEDGMLWFEDRSKDVIKTGGENVASIEVEKLVYEVSPEIAQAVVIGLPHDHWVEAITVVAVARPGSTIEPLEVIARLKGRLASFKVPKAVIVVDSLPMTSTGKLQKNVLRKQYAGYYAQRESGK